MIVYSMLGITLVLALLSIYILWRGRNRTMSSNWPHVLVAISLAGFIYLYGVWVFLSVYLKYVFGGAFLLVLLALLVRKKADAIYKMRKNNIITNVVLSVLFLTLIVLYFTGTTGKPYGVANLSLPFKSGRYFVFQGGKGLPTNIFHFSGRHTVFAMDIIKLNDAGNRARHIFSKKLEDYEIFNDTIYSPCNGVIVKTESGNPDNIPPLRKRGPHNLNMVLIETDSIYVFLGHLKQGGVFVHEGDTVATGCPLGLAGNSGMSLEPHLHIQAHAKTDAAIPWYKEPQLLIQFNGKSYLLFEEINTH